MNKLAVVVPYYMGFSDKSEMLAKCLLSLKGQDALFVVGHSDKNLPWAINTGFETSARWGATHMVVISDDMQLIDGDLRMLMHDEYVTHPFVNGVRDNNALGGVLCFPMNVIRKLIKDGHFYDENFIQGYYDDDDIFYRLSKNGIDRRIVTSVNVSHPEPGATLGRMNFDSEINKRYFEDKHNIAWEKWSLPPDLEA